MTVSADREAQVQDLFQGLGSISTRAMFGGSGVYCDGVMFALIGRDRTVYVKAEGVMARALAAEGSEPFTYTHDGADRSLGYWRLPEDACEDPEQARIWGARSLDLARAARRG